MGVWTRDGRIDGKEWVAIFDIAIISLMLAATVYTIFNYEDMMNLASVDIQYYGLWALFLLVFLFEFLPQIISPDYTLLLSIGLGINIYSAVIVTIIASTVGSWLAFMVGYHCGFGVIAPFFTEDKLNKILKFWRKHGKWFVLAAGTIPLPVPYIPIVFGALRMRKKDFILWGLIPRAIGFIATGIVGYYWLGLAMRFF